MLSSLYKSNEKQAFKKTSWTDTVTVQLVFLNYSDSIRYCSK
ncbi:hypothetical protein BN424_2369 [Carnobacterium maltaromaticum LMA28]|uniref:Uncharacterized protein n=1 Tax=Carnobacterium maltaromaticum LMA28 TaxID=1234679 RepID=K8E5B1_CARML|nr:hypothetical protein BN424_2369 [Carnobacterium maltaromaticum LMA28]